MELQKLCDKVPSFDSKLAMATVEKELGKPVDELFSELTAEPVGTCVCVWRRKEGRCWLSGLDMSDLCHRSRRVT